ncbi:hypothetical protein [Streptomyces sp. NPDC093109]|uniref:hypothetical protein n=1 Tax=Streptomyces sp. NPDC093109 TaxID=3154977 RepID=UPI00344F1F0E
MVLSVSAVVLLGIALAVLLRARRLGALAATVAVLFGFFLASTGLADPIRTALSSLAHLVTQISI